MLKIEFTSDLRTFKTGETFTFDNPLSVIVGENGCGKSTLLQVIRGKYLEGKESDVNKSDYEKLSKSANIESDYDKIFYVDSINDDAYHMNNCYDAYEFIQHNAIDVKDKSHGQKSMTYFSLKINKAVQYREKNPNAKILLILDEFDKGFDIPNQKKAFGFLNLLIEKYKFDIICITHNIQTINRVESVLDLKNRVWVSGFEYLFNLGVHLFS